MLEAAKSDLEALMRDDEQIAERMEQEHAAEFAARSAEVDTAITEGAAGWARSRPARIRVAVPAAQLVRWTAWTFWTASSVS